MSAIRDSSHAMKVPLVQRGRLHTYVSHFGAERHQADRIELHPLQGVDRGMTCALHLMSIEH